jgi:hypothetical protein
VFVFDPVAKPLIVTNTKQPKDLVLGEVGVFRSDTLVGAGATPTSTSAPILTIHQNVGDSDFGTVRSKHISAQKVIRWFGQRAAAVAAQTTYIGYDETDATKDIVIKKGQEVNVTVLVYDHKLTRWYGPSPYKKVFPIEVGYCDVCAADCTVLNKLEVATLIANAINGTPAGNNIDYPEGSELKNYMTASVVTTGAGDAAVYGVKIVGTTPTEQALNACDPKDFYEPATTTFTVSLNNQCTSVPITTTASASPGCGWPAEVANYEKESQGYDRVREVFDYNQWMRTNFVINAKPGVKYDFYAIEFDWNHRSSGVSPSSAIDEPYSIVFWVPTTTGTTIEALFNAWLTPLGFTAVNVASGTITGSTSRIVNA